MYISSNEDQLTIEDFFMPFGGKLLKSNRWVKLASMMPWEHIEQIYMESVELERGRPATSSRIAFGAIFIKENDNLTDESTVKEHSAQSTKKDKNTSKKKLKRKRSKKNRGKLIMDATVAPADIKYPTDIDLLNKSR